jgi:3-deoxy-D-manno-octulosonic-acid transferase
LSLLLLDILYLIIGLPLAAAAALLRPRFRTGWRQRLGGVPELPERPRIWVHCVSVGEVLLARTLVERLAQTEPDVDVVISTSTSTGREAALTRFPERTVFFFPLDLSPVVRRILQRIRPTAVILVELEVWPNFLAVARRSGVPVVVVNGRISERSARRYGWLGPLARALFGRVACYAVQSDEYAARFERLGVPRERICVAGTMKYDTVATDVSPDVVADYRDQFRLSESPSVLLGGCTHPGEDELLIDYTKQRQHRGEPIRLVLAPRHRERAEPIETAARAAGFAVVRKTALDAGDVAIGSEPTVVIVDTTGELGRLYALATVAFVGGSLIEHGGQNMIEPAALGRPVVFGPHTWNFRDTVELLLKAGGAVQVAGADELERTLDDLFEDPARRTELGRNARTAVLSAQGATERTFNAIRPFLDRLAKETC